MKGLTSTSLFTSVQLVQVPGDDELCLLHVDGGDESTGIETLYQVVVGERRSPLMIGSGEAWRVLINGGVDCASQDWTKDINKKIVRD